MCQENDWIGISIDYRMPCYRLVNYTKNRLSIVIVTKDTTDVLARTIRKCMYYTYLVFNDILCIREKRLTAMYETIRQSCDSPTVSGRRLFPPYNDANQHSTQAPRTDIDTTYDTVEAGLLSAHSLIFMDRTRLTIVTVWISLTPEK